MVSYAQHIMSERANWFRARKFSAHFQVLTLLLPHSVFLPFSSLLWALLNAWAILNLGILQSRPPLFAAGFVTFYPKSHRTQLFPPELLPSSVAHYALLAALLLL